MGILLCEQNFRDVWRRNKSVRGEIGKILHTHKHTHTRGQISSKDNVNVIYTVIRNVTTKLSYRPTIILKTLHPFLLPMAQHVTVLSIMLPELYMHARFYTS